MKVEGLALGPVRLLGDEVFMKCLAVLRMEAMPEEGIALTSSYSPCFEKGLAEHVEVVVVVDHVSFFFHR